MMDSDKESAVSTIVNPPLDSPNPRNSFIPLSTGRAYLLELPRELRDYIYSFLPVAQNALIAERSHASCVWEVRVSAYPNENAPLFINRQMSSEYSAFINRLFAKCKLLFSTNALTSPPPWEIKHRRIRALLTRIRYVVFRGLADWKWWVSYSQASWPHTVFDRFWPHLLSCTTIEFACQLVGRSVFIPNGLLIGGFLGAARKNASEFFEYKVPRDFLHAQHCYHQTESKPTPGIPEALRVKKTLVLEPGPFEPMIGEEDPSHRQAVFRDVMNSAGARFPVTDDWYAQSIQTLDPLICQSHLSTSLERYNYRAAVYSVEEQAI
jgi:hypothetical protein